MYPTFTVLEIEVLSSLLFLSRRLKDSLREMGIDRMSHVGARNGDYFGVGDEKSLLRGITVGFYCFFSSRYRTVVFFAPSLQVVRQEGPVDRFGGAWAIPTLV